MQKRLECLSVHYSGHAFHKVINVGKKAVFLAFCEDCTYYIVTESLDSAETESDFSLLVDRKLGIRLIDVRVKHLDAAFLAVVHDLLDLVHIGEILREVGRLEFSRVVRLEPACLVAYPGIAGRMRLVECI